MPAPEIGLHAARVDDAEALAHILITAMDAAFRGRVPDRCLAFTETERAANWRRALVAGLPPDGFLVVAEWPGGPPVGYAWGGPRDDDSLYRGERRQIHVLPCDQGKGIGRLLVSHVAGWLADRGIHRLRVEVLTVNPHRGFHERLGARWLAEHGYDWDGVVLPECVYGWANTRPLRDCRPQRVPRYPMPSALPSASPSASASARSSSRVRPSASAAAATSSGRVAETQ